MTSQDITYVYAIGSDEGPVKIGITSNLLARMAQLKTASPQALRLIYAMPCSSREDAKEHESAIHDSWAEHRLNGEWFNIDADLAIEAIETNFQIFQWMLHERVFKHMGNKA